MNSTIKRLIISLILITIFSSTFTFAQTSSISDEDYFVIYTTMLNKTQKRLTYINKKSSLAKVGTETINGKISGTLFYDVKIKGMGAVVTLRYTDYCDEEGWSFDGEIITTANMAQNGTICGVMTVSGNYSGKIYYENAVLKDGKPGAGTYGVEQAGSSRKEVPYTWYFKAEN